MSRESLQKMPQVSCWKQQNSESAAKSVNKEGEEGVSEQPRDMQRRGAPAGRFTTPW